jgi:hypothetical protein
MAPNLDVLVRGAVTVSGCPKPSLASPSSTLIFKLLLVSPILTSTILDVWYIDHLFQLVLTIFIIYRIINLTLKKLAILGALQQCRICTTVYEGTRGGTCSTVNEL